MEFRHGTATGRGDRREVLSLADSHERYSQGLCRSSLFVAVAYRHAHHRRLRCPLDVVAAHTSPLFVFAAGIGAHRRYHLLRKNFQGGGEDIDLRPVGGAENVLRSDERQR